MESGARYPLRGRSAGGIVEGALPPTRQAFPIVQDDAMIDAPDGLTSPPGHACRSGGAIALHDFRRGAGRANQARRRASVTVGWTDGAAAVERPSAPAPGRRVVAAPESRRGSVTGVIRAIGEAAP